MKRTPKSKTGELKAQWGDSRDQGPDIYYCWGAGCGKSDGALLHYIFGCERPPVFSSEKQWRPGFIDELKNRGYDITTFKFSIKKSGERPSGAGSK